MLAYKHALADALEARAGLSGVLVTTGFVSDIGAQDSIQIYEADGEQSWGALGNKRREEEWELGGEIIAQRAGKGEDVIRETEVRAFAILAEMEAELRKNTSVATIADLVAMVRYEVSNEATASSRYCIVKFVISGRKSLQSS